MRGLARRLAPMLPLLMSIWCAYDAVSAGQGGRTGKAVWEGVKALLFLGVAYLIHDTGKRFPEA
jgi:hypothetical protein